ncbi:hypothetical protein C8T65DRAFT_740402 [Cerioporus squamosus]|nr:hypothetical protein C8T65DRAFT_740402 [Cerioporus squamosus]
MKAQKIPHDDYIILASVLSEFGHERSSFKYEQFLKVMKTRGFREHRSGALLPPQGAGRFAYKRVVRDRDGLVRRTKMPPGFRPSRDLQVTTIDEPDSTDPTKPDGAANIEDSNAPQDVSMEVGPSQPANASAPADDPTKSADGLADAPQADEDDARKAEAVPTIIAPPTSRPTKRRRKDPVLKTNHPAASSSTGRVTRSRSAAMLALASAAAPPAPVVPPAPPQPAASEPVPPAQGELQPGSVVVQRREARR